MDYPANYTIKKYKPRNLTERQLKFCEAYLIEPSATKSAKIAGYNSPARSGHTLIQCKRILDYLNKRESKLVNVGMTFESKVEVLKHVIDQAIPMGEPLTNRVGDGLKSIQELNRMQGHYAPTQNQNMNVNVEIDSKDASNLFKQLLEQSTRDY